MPAPDERTMHRLVSLPQDLRTVCERFARVPYPVLILGERGTGKTALARMLHTLSARSGEFTWVSVPDLPEGLERAELHGHSRGAYTGADRDRAGYAEVANRGTLFLDEIGLARMTVQQLLLKLLDSAEVTRLGETRSRPLDVRYVAATNENLDVAVAEGRFRADLRDRFGRLVLQVPALRDRSSEIVPIAEAFMAVEAESLRFPGPVRLTEPAARLLMAAPWPGNIRELLQVCRFALTMAHPSCEITPAHLPEDIGGGTMGAMLVRSRSKVSTDEVLRAISDAGGNISEAARRLPIDRRQVHRIVKQAADRRRVADG